MLKCNFEQANGSLLHKPSFYLKINLKTSLALQFYFAANSTEIHWAKQFKASIKTEKVANEFIFLLVRSVSTAGCLQRDMILRCQKGENIIRAIDLRYWQNGWFLALVYTSWNERCAERCPLLYRRTRWEIYICVIDVVMNKSKRLYFGQIFLSDALYRKEPVHW